MFLRAVLLATAALLVGSLVLPYRAHAQLMGVDPGHEDMPAEPTPIAPPPPDMSFTTRVDKTAVWVGDLFTYTIAVDHPAEAEFVLENLNKETLTMDPLRVMDVNHNTVTLKDGRRRLFVNVTLTSFMVGQAQIAIPQLTLFYFRREGAGTSTSEGAAAESLTIPGPKIALRSTLPPEPDDLRDAATVTGWASTRWIVPTVGWAALALLLAGVGWEATMFLQSKKGRKGPDPRKAMAAIQDRWSRSIPSDFSDPRAVMDFCGRSYQDVKEYLGYFLEAPTEGLTAEEMREEMARRAANPDLTDRTAKVLSTCEVSRYARNGKDLTPETGRTVEHEVRQIFETARL
jgi:hypothetical protein